MSKWISVKDRLPVPHRDVLVLGHGGDMDVRHLLDDVSRGWYPGGWGLGWTTHWKPLPELPEGWEKVEISHG